MITATEALNITQEALKFKENVWAQIEKAITMQAKAGRRICEYEVYPDSPLSVEEIVRGLNGEGFKTDVETYDEAELEFDVEYCHVVVISW